MCHKLSIHPTLDTFASQRCNQLPRFMSWEIGDRAVAANALIRQWDRITWLSPLVPLLPTVQQLVEEQQINAILICPGWVGSMWLSQVSNLRMQDPVRLLWAVRFCRYPKGCAASLPKLDLLLPIYISGSLWMLAATRMCWMKETGSSLTNTSGKGPGMVTVWDDNCSVPRHYTQVLYNTHCIV